MTTFPGSPPASHGWPWASAVPYYRRRAKAREQAAQAHAAAVLDRLQWQVAELRASLEKMAAANAVMVRELGTP